MSNLSSAKTANHSTSRGRRTRRRASGGFCVRSKTGAAKAAIITLSPPMTSRPLTARRQTAKGPSPVLSVEQASRRRPFQCPEGMEMFHYLADRKALLFPEEDRVICKVETEPALYGDVVVRVASAL